MKNSPFFGRKQAPKRRGIALVIVLGFLVLITVLIVAYFTSVTNEYSTTKTYANGTTAKFLSDSAVNIVMGQIAKGTQGQGAGGTRLTWASQPGMIHTWSDQAPGYAASEGDCYKLYSSGQMVIPASAWSAEVTQAVNGGQDPDVPLNWSSQPAIYTDLNAPVIDSSGSANFPIIDGNNVMRMTVSGSNELSYHSSANSALTPDIEGFYVQPSYVPNYTPPSASKPLSATNTPVPMPVQWLYTLKDGTVIAPDNPPASGNGSTATFQHAAVQPSAANPIVGRIAFWTDDETCKLNINTASEGTYYAIPHANTRTDMTSTSKANFGFAVSPPANGEYNRYPGHPATTCLSVVLGTWMNSLLDKEAPNAYTSVPSDQSYLKDLTNYQYLVPRTGTGGSLAGTMPVTSSTFNVVISATNRLYASFDEVMFNPSRVPNVAAANPQTLTKPELEEMKFFLTANSRAPELTPFNTPKVSLWPQWSGTNDRQQHQTPTEQLLAFCSSFGPHGVNSSSASTQFEYFWEWGNSNLQFVGQPWAGWYNVNAYSSTCDWSGTDGNSTAYSTMRNKALAKYLCNLGDRPIPGYGAAFRSTSKYSDRCFSNIVVDCLDYIRTCVDRVDYFYPGGATAEGFSNDAWGVLVPPLLVADNNTLPGVSKSMPVKGFGFTPVFSKVALSANLKTSGGQSYYVPTLTFEGYLPTWANPGGQPPLSITLSWKGLESLGLTDTIDPAPPNGQWTVGVFVTTDIYSGPFAGQDSPYGRNLPVRPWSVTLSNWRFANSTFTTGSSSSLTLGGGPLQFSFPDYYGTTYQTESVTFNPRVLFQIPAKPKVNPYTSVSRSMDCNARTVAKGDYRILGGTVNISSIASPSSSGTTGNLYSQCVGSGSATYSGTSANVNSEYLYCRAMTQVAGVPTATIAGTLAPVVSGTTAILSSSDYGSESAPLAPQGMQGAMNINNRPGDWDTGTGVFPDGPWINARDQQDNNSSYGPLAGYFPSYAWPGGYVKSFSPNRRIDSAIQFGSIPSGVSASPTPRPWETLLFCPNPAARTSSPLPGADTSQDSDHIGFLNPPDHLLADFFTMPVVQPYAISEPLSTAGKVNLNYQLAPFTSIERSTALRGVLKNTLMMGISGYDVQSKTYKSDTTSPYEFRYDINRDATVAGIDEHYFSQGNVFRYPSEICDVFLVPTYLGTSQPFTSPPSRPSFYNSKDAQVPTTYDKMLAWWNPSGGEDPLSTMCMTGVNLRDEPYDHLYPRLTTQSNTFTVHCRVQVLQKRPGLNNQNVWNEGQDVVVSEYRGSSLIERYIDPSDPRLTGNWDKATMAVDFTQNVGSTTDANADLSQLYKFRVVNTKKFAP